MPKANMIHKYLSLSDNRGFKMFVAFQTITVHQHFTSPKQLLLTLKERVHSEMKIIDKIQFTFFSKSVSFPSDITSGHKISFPGPVLSLPGTCIIASEDLHFHFRDLHFCFRTCIITSRTCIITSGPVLFYCNLSVKKNKTNGRKLT